ncbi:MAG: hypothetical protein KF797_10640 [Flavobacteriales bacterium]|nr:hypothetical protein [Flavobacteriales bacterium]
MDIKGAIADHMGHFSVYDIPNLLFVLVAALVFGYLAARWGAGRQGAEARHDALWAATAALAAALVRSQLPLATLVLAAAVLVGRRGDARPDTTLLTMLLIGIGCGSGASVIVGIALVLFIPIMRWALRGEKQA